MRQLDAFLVWLGIIVIGLLALIFSFYVASVLLPIFLAVVVFSALFNLGAGWYRKYRDVRRVDVFSAKPREKQAPDINRGFFLDYFLPVRQADFRSLQVILF